VEGAAELVWVWVSWLERGGWGTFLLLLLLLLLPLLVLRRRSRTVRASLRISALGWAPDKRHTQQYSSRCVEQSALAHAAMHSPLLLAMQPTLLTSVLALTG